jgi:chromosome segregation ATPase
MPTTTDTDLKELKDLVNGLREEMNQRFAQMGTKLAETKAELKGEIQRVEAKIDAQFTEVKGDIKAVDQRVVALDGNMTGLDDRLKAQDAKFWTLPLLITEGSLWWYCTT